MRIMELPKVPNGENVILALVVDKESMRERILVGSEYGVRLRLEGNMDAEVFYDRERPVGTLFLDHDAQERDDWNAEVIFPLRSALMESRTRNVQESMACRKLKEELESDNAISLYIACRALMYYCPAANRSRNEQCAERLVEKMQILTASCTHRVLHKDDLQLGKIMERMGERIRNKSFRYHPELQIWYPWYKCGQECAVAGESLLPLLLYYLRRLDDWGMCFCVCEVCGKFFVAESGHRALCSSDCQKVQNRLNKQAYDQRNKDNKQEHQYQQIRDRIRRILNIYIAGKDTSMEQAHYAEKEYEKFRNEAKAQKNSVSNNEEGRAFVDWLFAQYSIFEERYGGKA